MLESVRSRVAIRYSALFGLLAISIGLGVYSGLQRDAYHRLDGNGYGLLNIAVSELHHEFLEHPTRAAAEASLRDVVTTVYQTSFPQEQVAIWNGSRLVAYKPNIGRSQDDLRAVSIPPGTGAFSHGDLRVVAATVFEPSARTHYRIAVSSWRGDTQNDLAALSRTLAILIPLAILSVVIAGFFLARRTLSPLSEITAAIDAITPKTLGACLPVPPSPDEIRRLATRFNGLLERLQSAFNQQGRFMADASHELRTPVTAALTAAQVTLRHRNRSPDTYREALQIIEEQMLRLRRIVDDMFLLARADTDSLPVRNEEFYLDELLAEAVRTMQLIATRSGVTLTVQKPLPEVRIFADSGLLRQAIIILLDNACKYNAAGGAVRVSLDFASSSCQLRVADTGPGIPVEAAEQIFERFFRLDTARASGRTGGSGLGLAIARWIVEQHGGTLTLESSSPAGSQFLLNLPAPPATTASLASD